MGLSVGGLFSLRFRGGGEEEVVLQQRQGGRFLWVDGGWQFQRFNDWFAREKKQILHIYTP